MSSIVVKYIYISNTNIVNGKVFTIHNVILCGSHNMRATRYMRVGVFAFNIFFFSESLLNIRTCLNCFFFSCTSCRCNRSRTKNYVTNTTTIYCFLFLYKITLGSFACFAFVVFFLQLQITNENFA